jgi:tetratricopeptide (TPR) repeat protein
VKEDKARKDEYQKALVAYAEGIKEFRKGKFERAAELLQSFIEKFPVERELVDRAKTYLRLSLERSGEAKESVVLKDVEDYYQYGIFKTNARDYEEAQKLLEKALKLAPEEGRIHYALADLFCLMGQSDIGLEYLKKAIQIDKFFKVLAQNEADFEPLWEDKKFKLITRIV